jgi:hypothetical protein
LSEPYIGKFGCGNTLSYGKWSVYQDSLFLFNDSTMVSSIMYKNREKLNFELLDENHFRSITGVKDSMKVQIFERKVSEHLRE